MEFGSFWAVMHRFEHLWSDERAPSDDALEGDHVAKMGCTKSSRIDMVVAKGSAEPDFELLALNVMFFLIVDNFYALQQPLIKGGHVIVWLF